MEFKVLRIGESIKSFLRLSMVLSTLFLAVACEKQSVVKLPTLQKGYDYDWFQLDAKDMSTNRFCFPKVFINGLRFLQTNYPDAKYEVYYHLKQLDDRGTLQPICTDKNANFISKVCLIADNGGNPHNICVGN